MFSWIEPQFGTTVGVSQTMSAKKFFALENDVSVESDINGTITFTNLTIVGAADQVAYLLICIDGVASVWTTIYNPSIQ